MNQNHVKNVFACAALLCVAAAAARSPDRAPDSYAQPGQRIAIAGGRHLNLRCDGSGSPIVLLEAGANADTTTWYKLQPLIARFARVCAYDRAGYGFSDEGPLPRDLDADVKDLHALVVTANIGTPLILVGHSLGSNIVRRYASLHPGAVAGMVLVDPPPQHIAAFSPGWAKSEAAARTSMFAFMRQCEQASESGQLASPLPALKACLAGPNPNFSAKLNASIRNYKSRPAFWRTLISEQQANGALFEQPAPADESHGALPLIVLSADRAFSDASPDDRKTLEAARDRTHAQISATSTRGKRIDVAQSSHEMQLDQPRAVADAVAVVIRDSRKAR